MNRFVMQGNKKYIKSKKGGLLRVWTDLNGLEYVTVNGMNFPI